MNGLSSRIAGMSAILFVVAMVVGVNLAFDSPDTDATDSEWTAWVKDGGNLVRNIIGGYTMVVAAILFIIFIVAMYQRFRANDGDGGWATVMLATGLGWASALAIGAILIETIPGTIKFGQGPEPTAETARWVTQTGFGVMLVAGGLCAGAAAAIMSALILRTKALPAWLGYFGFLGAIGMFAAAFFLPMIIFGLWMLAMGVVLIMRSDSPAMAASKA
ncbi:MAG: DUF4386 family protein [Chloroflexota bacterium]